MEQTCPRCGRPSCRVSQASTKHVKAAYQSYLLPPDEPSDRPYQIITFLATLSIVIFSFVGLWLSQTTQDNGRLLLVVLLAWSWSVVVWAISKKVNVAREHRHWQKHLKRWQGRLYYCDHDAIFFTEDINVYPVEWLPRYVRKAL